MDAKHTQWEVITRSGWAGSIETPRTSATLIINTDDFDTLEDVRQAVESVPALRAENERLREALQNALNVLAGIATGDLKTVRKDSPAIIQARAALAGGK